MTSTLFGELDGSKIYLYHLEDPEKQSKVSITSYAAALRSFVVKDKHQNSIDVVLGFDNAKDYIDDKLIFGASNGRYANRIGNGIVSLDGIQYQLNKNHGNHCIHGGERPFHSYNWKLVSLTSNSVCLSHVSPHLDMGFPGKLNATVTYTLNSGGRLSIEYTAETDKPTVVNLSCHAYFNLSGHETGVEEIRKHYVQLLTDTYLKADNDSIVVGAESVNGKVYDLRSETVLGDVIDNVPGDLGFDTAYSYSGEFGSVIAKARSERTGLQLEMKSNQPSVQFYNSGYVHNIRGKEGAIYQKNSGLCFEGQAWPNAPNIKEAPSAVLRPDHKYYHHTEYRVFMYGS